MLQHLFVRKTVACPNVTAENLEYFPVLQEGVVGGLMRALEQCFFFSLICWLNPTYSCTGK